ncbi:MAG: hypothetical protein GXO43_06085 [Crenarchaeota archaeon]|nr:hypothetical protein [Thermoproteota archaeon]
MEEPVCSEDRLFDEKVIRLIEDTHWVRVDRGSIRRRYKLRPTNIEVDVMFMARTNGNGVPRIFILELKESDLDKVLRQAVIRSRYAHYTYTVIDFSPEYIVDYIIRYWETHAKKLAQYGVGIISYRKPCDHYDPDYGKTEPVLVRKAKYHNIYGFSRYPVARHPVKPYA